MFIHNEYYSGIIPDDGLISDYELEMRLYSADILDDLLDERRYFQFIIGTPALANK